MKIPSLGPGSSGGTKESTVMMGDVNVNYVDFLTLSLFSSIQLKTVCFASKC